MRVVPSFVKADGSSHPVQVVTALGTRTMQDLLDEVTTRATESVQEIPADPAPVGTVSLDQLDSTDPLEVIGHVLGDEGLDGRRSVALKPDMSINIATASIGDSGDFFVTNITRDGLTSRFEDVWRVESIFKKVILERLPSEQFPQGIPLDDSSPEVTDELLLRLIRARLPSVSCVTGWMREAGISWGYSEQCHGGWSSQLRDD